MKKLKRRPGDKIFSTLTIFDDWAFHHGGRTETQFNIGYADGENSDYLRYGVAFSFERSQTLPSIDVLVPQVKFFNDFMALNAGDFSDMRMWHYDENGRSEDRPPGPIPSALVTEGESGERTAPSAIAPVEPSAHRLVVWQHASCRHLTMPTAMKLWLDA